MMGAMAARARPAVAMDIEDAAPTAKALLERAAAAARAAGGQEGASPRPPSTPGSAVAAEARVELSTPHAARARGPAVPEPASPVPSRQDDYTGWLRVQKRKWMAALGKVRRGVASRRAVAGCMPLLGLSHHAPSLSPQRAAKRARRAAVAARQASDDEDDATTSGAVGAFFRQQQASAAWHGA